MIVPSKGFSSSIFFMFAKSFPDAVITLSPNSAAFLVATGSKGQFLPGIHSSPTIFLYSSQVRVSKGSALGLVLGSAV